jgi:hypothetical protein
MAFYLCVKSFSLSNEERFIKNQVYHINSGGNLIVSKKGIRSYLSEENRKKHFIFVGDDHFDSSGGGGKK